MKIKFLLLVLISFFLITPNTLAKQNSDSIIIIDEKSGRVLYEKNSQEKKLIASTTKIMTAIIAIEKGNLNKEVIVGEEILKMYGTNIYIEVGEKIKLKDLIYGLLLRSGNDASLVIAKEISGSEEKFVVEMNKKAKELGMKNTIFNNPHGLDEETQNYSTAYDMALLMKYANSNVIYKKISSTHQYEVKTEKKTYLWYNRNKLLKKYKYCTGGKNGYTPSAGKTLVSTATKKDLSLIAVTLNNSNIYENQQQIYEEIFSEYKNYKIIDKEKINKNLILYNGYIKDDFYYPLTKEETENIKKFLHITKNSNKQNNKIIIYLNKKIIGEIPIYLKINTKKEENFFLKLKSFFIR